MAIIQNDAIQNAYRAVKQAEGYNGHEFVAGGDGAVAAKGAEMLQKALDLGITKAGPLIQRVLGEMPNDALPPAERLRFIVETPENGAGRLAMGWEPMNEGGTGVEYADGRAAWAERPVHANALSQIVGQVPQLTLPYVRSLIDSAEAWKHRLAEQILAEHFAHDPARYLVRSIAGEHRALLSANYRRLDARPLLDAFVGACNDVGARPIDGRATDVRVVVRAIIPRVFSVKGDVFCMGLTWQNSDYGVGAYSITAFVLRLLCLNAAMGESELRQIHLGRKLDDAEIFTRKTYELDTKTMGSATKDIVRALLSPKGLERKLGGIQAAADREVDFAQAVRPLRDRLTKGEQAKAKEAFEGKDDWNLPPGRTQWRASNALSWIAKDASEERAIELEQMAGKLLAV